MKNEFKPEDDLEDAGRYFYLNRTSYSGIMNHNNCYFGYNPKNSKPPEKWPELIRQTLLRVQTSILFDKKRKIRFAFPSKVSDHAKKIYHLLKIPSLSSPKIISHL